MIFLYTFLSLQLLYHLTEAQSYPNESEALSDDDFLSFPNETERSTEVCCNDVSILSCEKVLLDPRKLSEKKIKLNGIEFNFSNTIEPTRPVTIGSWARVLADP